MNQGPSIELLIPANHVEAVQGLFYMTGAGWTDVHRPAATGRNPVVWHFGIGISVLVPWDQTNLPHRLMVAIESENGESILENTEATLIVGRPPNIEPSSDQHAVVALSVNTPYPPTGRYRIIVRLNDAEERLWNFRVHDAPGPETPSQAD